MFFIFNIKRKQHGHRYCCLETAASNAVSDDVPAQRRQSRAAQDGKDLPGLGPGFQAPRDLVVPHALVDAPDR